jgi:hypothetical protein
MIRLRRFLPALILACCALAIAPHAVAQVRVDLSLKRGLFVRYEPVVAIVTISNLSGAPLELADDANRKWFSFQIESAAGPLVAPYNPDYTLSPLSIGPGETVRRAVNITPLYPITEYGIYRVKAVVYDRNIRKYFSSAPLNIEITEGRMIWKQEVGVPGGGGMRTITLFSHRLPDNTQLYLRVEDKASGIVYCTHQLGRLVMAGKPDVLIGGNNDIFILQNVAPKMFLFTHATLDGKITERKQYTSVQNVRPSMKRTADGGVEVVGGVYFDPEAARAQEQKNGPPPSVSDRPVPLPKSE